MPDMYGAPDALVSAVDWDSGDPCHTCGSKDTIWITDGVLMQAHCNGCQRDDWDDD